MKKYITLVVALFISVTLFAQTPPSGGGSGGGGSSTSNEGTFPVTKAMLDTYAMSLISQYNVQMWAPSAIRSFYTNVAYEGKVADVRELANAPNTVKPSILLANPAEDDVNYHVRYESTRIPGKDYPYALFWGYDAKKPVVEKGGWALPTFYVGRLYRTDRVPYLVKGLRNAHMIIRDEAGNVIDNYYFDEDNRIDRQNGILWLGDEQMDRIGEIYIERQDENGESVTDVIGLVSGREIVPERLVSASVDVNFPAVPLPDNTTLIKPRFIETKGPVSAVFYVEYTQVTDVTVAFDTSSDFKVEIFAIDADDLAEGPEGWSPIAPGNYRIEGERRLFFRFESGPKNTTPIPYPQDDGGKGVAVAVEP